MQSKIWLTAVLALAGAGAVTARATGLAVVVEDDFEALVAEYDQAVVEWRERLRNAERDERSGVREAHPAKEFWPRFEQAADAGEGRALLWLVQHLKDAGYSLRERSKAAVPLLDRLVDEHREAEWFGDALSEIERLDSRLERPRVIGYYELVATKTERLATRGQALYQWATLLADSDDEADVARADELFERLATEHTGSEWGRKAQVELAGKNLEPGKPAPNFEAQTIDGHSFQLSDYEGKVVLLDFYGFW